MWQKKHGRRQIAPTPSLDDSDVNSENMGNDSSDGLNGVPEDIDTGEQGGLPVHDMIIEGNGQTNLSIESDALKDFQEEQQKVGSQINVQNEQTLVREVVRNELFSAHKFMTDQDLIDGGEVTKFVMDELGIVDDMEKGNLRTDFWLRHKETVRREIMSKRASVTQSIKKQFLGEFRNSGRV